MKRAFFSFKAILFTVLFFLPQIGVAAGVIRNASYKISLLEYGLMGRGACADDLLFQLRFQGVALAGVCGIGEFPRNHIGAFDARKIKTIRL